jgi:putative peptidoglycan binding protein
VFIKKMIMIASGLVIWGVGAVRSQNLDELWFRPLDPLAQRDEYGLLHQSTDLYPTDFAPRYHWRPLYYLESGRDLAAQPAYVGSLQKSLQRLGYYCGPIDGIFSPELGGAIAHMQKNYSMRVTGTITIPVRRALHLP